MGSNGGLDDIDTLIAGGLQGGLWWLAVLELATEGVGIFSLVEVAQGMVDAAVDSFVSPDVENEVLHRALFLGDIPILAAGQLQTSCGSGAGVSYLDSNVGNLKLWVLPLG